MAFDFGTFLPPLVRGAGLTIFLCLISGSIGTLIGLVVGIARSSPWRVLRWTAAVYTNFIRGIPILIILLFSYFVLPLMFSAATFSRGVTAIAGLSIYAGAYIAEIFRGSIEAIPRGQLEAAEALGMHYVSEMRYIVLPQAMKIAVPPLVGFLIALVKASSLVSVIGYTDLTRAGQIITSQNQLPLTTFVIVAAFYFAISYPISLFGRWYERRIA